MRDPNRIPKILSEVEKVWNEHPDLRLGQLLSIIASFSGIDLFNIEDKMLIDLLKEKFKSKKDKGKIREKMHFEDSLGVLIETTNKLLEKAESPFRLIWEENDDPDDEDIHDLSPYDFLTLIPIK